MNHKPNILIIHADEHRFDCLGAYGNKEISTPNIDQLAKDGTVYQNSFCPFPVCTPSRYSLLTGLYVHQHLGWSNRCTLPSGQATFPKILRDADYKTEAVGKMHFSPTYLDVGFSKMTLAEQDGPGRHDDDYHRYLRDLNLCDRIDLMDQVAEFRKDAPEEYWKKLGALESGLPEEHHSTTWIAEQAISAVNTWDENGANALMIGFIKPHHPFDPPAPWSRLYDPEKLSLLPGWTETPFEFDLAMNKGYFPHAELTESSIKQATALYYASISQIDHHVGRLIEILKEKNIYDDTMIIYTSDHGDYMGFHHLILKGNHLYDPVVKVPLIIKYPGENKASLDDRLVNNIDLAPTILKLCGLNIPYEMPGLDLKGKERRSTVFAESSCEYMARTEKRKLLLHQNENQSVYFDLEEDPLELNNLFNDERYRHEIDEMRKELSNWIMFDAKTVNHIDWEAPVIDEINVVNHGGEQHLESIEYFKKQMENSACEQ